LNTNIHRKSYCVVIGGLNLDIQAFATLNISLVTQIPGKFIGAQEALAAI